MTAHRRKIDQAALLWERGYRHGDHVLVYDAPLGLFREEVLTKFYDEPALMPPDMAVKFEEAQGTRVKPEDRSQSKSQPTLASHETGLEIFLNNSELATRLETAVGNKLKKLKEDRKIRQEKHLLAHYYSLFLNDPQRYDKEMAELAKKNPRMAKDFRGMFDSILEGYKNKLEKETEKMREELTQTYDAIEKELEELERMQLSQEVKMGGVDKEDEGSK
ncbi:MAG TPA: hypothetical protein ENJ92_00160 [Chloroflexi bacterium]|nr:hypothetical protein [Chloroflexota bacterium]